jgi:putative hemin transport protein
MRFPEFTQTLSLEQYYEQSAENLKTAWQKLREADPALRIRDAAEQLGVSEAELLALACGGTATRLAADWAELIQSLPRLGRVLALTRNDHAVHEKHGRYIDPAAAGLAPDDALELRLFPERWRFGFAVAERGPGGERHGLQFFDAHGGAVHKVYLTAASHRGAYENLVERYAAPDQSPWREVTPRPEADSDSAGERRRAGAPEPAVWRDVLDALPPAEGEPA